MAATALLCLGRSELAHQLAARLAADVRAYAVTSGDAAAIVEAVAAARGSGASRLLLLSTAIFPSRQAELDRAVARRAAARAGLACEAVVGWHLHPAVIACLAARLRRAREAFPVDVRRRTTVIFIGTSLPLREVQRGDPYPAAARATAGAVAGELALPQWHLAWDGAARDGVARVGPDAHDILPLLARMGLTGAILCPLDDEARPRDDGRDLRVHARSLGLGLAVTALLDADPTLADALADLCRERLREPIHTAR